jgi:hypothetical protein
MASKLPAWKAFWAFDKPICNQPVAGSNPVTSFPDGHTFSLVSKGFQRLA